MDRTGTGNGGEAGVHEGGDAKAGAKDDPRAPGGVFERVGGLLSELLDRDKILRLQMIYRMNTNSFWRRLA